MSTHKNKNKNSRCSITHSLFLILISICIACMLHIQNTIYRISINICPNGINVKYALVPKMFDDRRVEEGEKEAERRKNGNRSAFVYYTLGAYGIYVGGKLWFFGNIYDSTSIHKSDECAGGISSLRQSCESKINSNTNLVAESASTSAYDSLRVWQALTNTFIPLDNTLNTEYTRKMYKINASLLIFKTNFYFSSFFLFNY